MNPSYTPRSDGLWGLTVPHHSATATAALDPAASPDVNQQDSEGGPFQCQSCGRICTRLCELNKHLKTHIRPFKCPIEDCSYHNFGWPTEKELDRHYNDKHSTEPRIFSCLWHGCSYTSKRESNCKQHMEKVHGYRYIRNRAGNRDENPDQSIGPSADVNRQFVQPRVKLAIRTVPDVLLTPSSLDQCISAQVDNPSPMDLNGPLPYGPEAYVPWNSPANTMRNDEAFLEGFSHMCPPGTPVAVQDSEWLRVPVDPRLYNPSSCGSNTPEESPNVQVNPNRDELLKALPMIVTPKTSPIATSQVLTPVSEPSPTAIQEPESRREATTSRDAHPRRQAGAYDLGASQAGNLNPYGKRPIRSSKDRDDDSDEGEEPPVKRTRAPGGVDEDIGDPKMICPFRRAHPEIYELDKQSKYWSCHTEHNNISTVVRHLGRPAHNLVVDNSRQAISSFDTENEHGHPAAGLCKKCWRSFTDRDDFEKHFLTKCETVSRSKREKYQKLLDTFCRLPSDDDSAADNSHNGASDLEDAEGDIETIARHRDLVSRREYLTLVDRVAALERILAARTPGASQSTPRTVPSQQASVAAARAFTSSPALPSQAFGSYYSFDSGPGSSSRRPGGGGSSDPRTVVVGGGDQALGGFYGDTERIAPGFIGDSSSRRIDGLPTVQRSSPLTAVAGGGGPAAARQQQPRAASDSSYRPDAAAAAAAVSGGSASGGNPATLVGHSHGLGHQHQHQHHLASHPLPTHAQQHGQMGAFVGSPGPGDAQASSSQQSANTMMRERWNQAVEVGEVMMERLFFDQGGPSDDIANYLDMNTQ